MHKHNLLRPYNVALRSCLNCGCHFCTMGNNNPLLLVLFLGTFVSSDGWSQTQTISPANTTTLSALGTITYSMFNLRWGAVFSVSCDLKGRFSSSCRDTIMYVLDLEKRWKNWSGVCRTQTQEVFADVYVSKLRTGSSETQGIQQSSSGSWWEQNPPLQTHTKSPCTSEGAEQVYSKINVLNICNMRCFSMWKSRQTILKIWFQLNNVTCTPSSNRLILSKT